MNAGDIIFGKFIGRGFDLVLLFLTAAPFLFVPILMGGVGWDQALCIIFAILSLLWLALAAGILFSTFCSNGGMAAFATYMLLLLYNLGLILICERWPMGLHLHVLPGIELSAPTRWLRAASPVTALYTSSLHNSLVALLWSGIVSVGCLFLSVWRLPRTLYPGWLRDRFTPLAKRLLIRPIRGSRLVQERNPVVWLDLSRGARWSWILQGIAAAGLIVWVAWVYRQWDIKPAGSGRSQLEGLYFAGFAIAYCVKLLAILFASRVFASGKDDGSLELLLISPLSNRQLVHGKWLALLGHYGVLFGLACTLIAASGSLTDKKDFPTELLGVVTGTIFATSAALLISAWAKSTRQAVGFSFLATIVFGWFINAILSIPVMLFGIRQSMVSMNPPHSAWLVSITPLAFELIRIFLRPILELAIAWFAYRLLIRKLRVLAAR
jgi:ABC-type transport system involved in multi-copper enzyme maturation permease subunit